MKWTGRPSRTILPTSLALGLILATLAPAIAEESWDATYLAGSKVGYVHTVVVPLKEKVADQALLNVKVNQVLSFKRNKDQISMQLRLGTIETPDGSVLRLDYRVGSGQAEMKNSGDVVDGKMTMTFEAGTTKTRKVIDWPDDVRGPYAVEQSVARKPMEPGETRRIKSFVPVKNEICNIDLTARDREDVPLGGGKMRNLLKVETKVSGLDEKPVQGMDVTYWFDEGGQAMKTSADFLGGVTTFRTTKAAALAPSDANFDIVKATLVKTRVIPRADQSKEVVYRITSLAKGEAPADLFPADRRQMVRVDQASKAVNLTVKTAGRDVGTAGPEKVDDAFLKPNPLINSDDPAVIALMKKAVGNATDPWQKATAIKHWVFENIKTKNYKTAFAPASEVAVNLAGDCTEHSVLVAAMCRAAGIPARVAVGLIYGETQGGFGGHMWNEVYINRRWVALDAAFDQSDVDAVHLKLSDSSLEGVSPFEAMLPILQVSESVKIDPVEVR